MNGENDVWLSTAEAAGYTRLSKRILRSLAQNRKLEFGQRTARGKFWFRKTDLDRFLSAFLLPTADGKDAVSTALRSAKIMMAPDYMPGELVTKADAAMMLGLKVRGIEHLVADKKLRPVALNLGHRTVAFTRKKILALKRIRAPYRPRAYRNYRARKKAA